MLFILIPDPWPLKPVLHRSTTCGIPATVYHLPSSLYQIPSLVSRAKARDSQVAPTFRSAFLASAQRADLKVSATAARQKPAPMEEPSAIKNGGPTTAAPLPHSNAGFAGMAPTSNSDPQETLGCGSAAQRYRRTGWGWRRPKTKAIGASTALRDEHISGDAEARLASRVGEHARKCPNRREIGVYSHASRTSQMETGGRGGLSNGVVRLQDWHGREVDAVRSRGGVWAFPDFSDNVIKSQPAHWPPPELVQKLCQSHQLSAFLPEDQSLLTHKLGYYSDLQSINSEDAIQWSYFGPLVYGSTDQRVAFTNWLLDHLKLPWRTRSCCLQLWCRVPHPDNLTPGGPEMDLFLQGDSCVIFCESKWRSGVEFTWSLVVRGSPPGVHGSSQHGQLPSGQTLSWAHLPPKREAYPEATNSRKIDSAGWQSVAHRQGEREPQCGFLCDCRSVDGVAQGSVLSEDHSTCATTNPHLCQNSLGGSFF